MAISAMSPGAQGPVADLYRSVLGRAPDQAGLEFWRNSLSGGATIEHIQNQMAASPEAQRLNARQMPQSNMQTGLAGSEQALQRGLAGGIAGLTEGVNTGRADIQQALNPFAQPGGQAMNMQAAMTGALGPEQQQQALANFQASPGQRFLQDRGQQALLRNQSAIGGLGGGRVQQELQRQGIGYANQAFGERFNQLGQLSGMGLQAAGNIGGTQAQLAGMGGQQAGQMAYNTGQSLSQGRTRVGEQMAAAVGGTASALSELVSQQGAGSADMIGAAGGNLAGLLSGAGQAQSGSQQQLATILANLASQKGSNLVGLRGIPGVQYQQGMLESIGNAAEGIGTGMKAF